MIGTRPAPPKAGSQPGERRSQSVRHRAGRAGTGAVAAFGFGASEGSGSPARQPPHPGPPSIWAVGQPGQWRDTGRLPVRPGEQPPRDMGMIRVTLQYQSMQHRASAADPIQRTVQISHRE